MSARGLVFVLAVTSCGRGASEQREAPASAPKGRRPTATLELKLVDPGAGLSKEAFMRAMQDIRKDNPAASEDDVLDGCLATATGVSTNIDYWEHTPGGKRYTDWYVTAVDRAALETYLAAFPTPADREWGHELHEERCGRDRATRPMWRSYYLVRGAELTGASVTKAEVHRNEYTNLHEVIVTFDAEGARRFADLTEKNAGHKMAILVDGTITSAPVIMERISGGRMSILMSIGSPEQAEKDARALAEALVPR